MKSFLYIVAVMLFLAILRMPYGFYQILRLLAVIGFLVIAYKEFEKSGWNTWCTLGIIGVLVFNPLFPIRLSKELWQVIDPLMGIIIGVYAYQLKSK